MSSEVEQIWCGRRRIAAACVFVQHFSIKHLVPWWTSEWLVNGCSSSIGFGPSENAVLLISSASFPKDLRSRCSRWVMQSSHSRLSVCKRLVFGRPWSVEIGSFNPPVHILRENLLQNHVHADAVSLCWWDIQTLGLLVPFNTGAVKLGFCSLLDPNQVENRTVTVFMLCAQSRLRFSGGSGEVFNGFGCKWHLHLQGGSPYHDDGGETPPMSCPVGDMCSNLKMPCVKL